MITILMATYNGESYLAEQIESILRQTETRWKLIIQDDCSTDRSAAVAQEYAEQYPEKIRLIRRDSPSGSAKNNFFSMLSLADTPYCMTCDQDDVWLPEKIALTLEKMRELESACGADTPLLVHTDLKVVDSRLNELSGSLLYIQDLSAKRDALHQLIVQNIVTGCAMMVNQALLARFVPIPEAQNCIMHDWWLAILAAAFGKIGFVETPTILYRQHGSNQVGAKNAHSLSYNWARFRDRAGARTVLRDTYRQAGEFLKVYRAKLDTQQVRLLDAYSGIPLHPKWKRVWVLLRYRLFKKGFKRKLAQILFV